MSQQHSAIKNIRLIPICITIFFNFLILIGGYYYNYQNSTQLIKQERAHNLQLYKQHIRDQVELLLSEVYTEKTFLEKEINSDSPEAIKEIQSEVIKHLQKAQYFSTRKDKSRYAFIYDKEDRYVLHIDKVRIGKLRSDFVPTTLDKILSFKNVYSRPGHGDFFTYSHKMYAQDSDEREKISYLTTIPEWEWVIGSGMYLDDIYEKTAAQEALIKKSSRRNLTILYSGCFLLTAIMLALIYRGTKLIYAKDLQHLREIKSSERKRKEVEERLNKSLHYDKLTKLSSYAYFEHNMSIVYNVPNVRQDGVLLSISLDNYRDICSLYGNDIGEFVLITTSNRLTELFDAHLVCHYSNDQFLVCFIPNMLRPDYYTLVDLLERKLKRPFELADYEVSVRFTIGVKPFIYNCESFENIVHHANIVVEQTKKEKGTRVGFFTHETKERIDRELYIIKALPQAILTNQLFVVYQPQINSKTGKLSGVETLCRWIDSSLGFVSPDEFISLAEKNSLIHFIGEYVFERACHDIQRFSPNGKDAITVSINISPVQMQQSNFVKKLEQIVKRTGIDPQRVIVEVTENLLISDLNKINDILSELHAFGFGISLDDFGTGYSSLSYLSHLPINEVKIDREFTMDLLENEQHQALVKAVSAICQAGDMEVVVEGVESAEQARWLAEHDCHLLQGFYYDKGLKIEELIDSYQHNLYRYY